VEHVTTSSSPKGINRRTAALLALAAPLALREAHAAVAAPDFTLRGIDGRNLRLAEQRGHVVMVNFWATWCGPCRVEMPHLNKIHDKYRSSGFVLLGVNVDEDAKKAAGAVQQWGIRFPVLHDAEKKVVRAYDVSSMPSTVLIDRDGRLRHVHRGYRDGYEVEYDKQVRELLKEA
jgi:peroxiredoxin